MCASAGSPRAPQVRTRFASHALLRCVQQSCSPTGRRLSVAALLVIMAVSSILADSALVTCRAPAKLWGMSTPAACLLLSQYVPATAALFAEFRRLRDGLPPADAREFAECSWCSQGVLGHATMMTEVRLCACPMLHPGACRAAELNPAPAP